MVFPVNSQPGIQRDGTLQDSSRYADGEWVRFQRGRPKKMGGYREIINSVNGPVYGIHVWPRQSTNLLTCFSGAGVEQVQVTDEFIGATVYDRTPTSWTVSDNVVWQYDTMYDSAAGSDKTLLIAHAGNNLRNIDNSVISPVYYGDASGTEAMTAIPSLNVSGGIVVAAPYLIGYGSDGYVTWSNQNEPRNFTTGDAGTARITDKKIIKGLQIRGGGPSVLLWSVDSVMRMTHIGGPAVFKFETLSGESSVLSSSGIIEFDGVYYWAGIDRFMVYNGAVQELPNDTNINYFYDNINFAHRQKVFAIKVPRYSEIWWFFPSDNSEVCNKAVIYNVREKVWYDAELRRSSGSSVKSVRYPVMSDTDHIVETMRIGITGQTGVFLKGDTVTGSFSTAVGIVYKVQGPFLYLVNVQGTFRAQPSETITGPNGSASTVNSAPVKLYSLWLHESGLNKIVGDQELSIKSFIETADFGILNSKQPANVSTRIVRLEPDFNQNGPITLTVVGSKSARGPVVESPAYEITDKTDTVDIRTQLRIMRLRFTSDSLNGDYEMGKNLVHIEPGDPKV